MKKVMTEKQKLKFKKRQLEDKIRCYRFLFKSGIEKPTEKNVEDWIQYNQTKSKPKSYQKARENAQSKIDLLKSIGFEERANKLEKVLKKKLNQNPKVFERMVYSCQNEIKKRLEYKTELTMPFNEEGCKIVFNPLIKYLIYCGTEEAEAGIYSACQKKNYHQEFNKIFGFGEEYETSNAKKLFEKIKIIRLGYLIGIISEFDIKGKKNRKNYYSARKKLRIIRENKS